MSGISPTMAVRTSSTSTCGTCGKRSTGRSACARLKPSGAVDTGCGGAPQVRIPIRLRLTIVYALSMTVVLTVAGSLVYLRLGAELLLTTDTALRTEANAVAAGIGQQGTAFDAPAVGPARGLVTFTQVLGPAGQVLETSPGIGGRPAVPAAVLTSIRG